MTEYEWRGSGPLRRGDDFISPGDEFEPTQAEEAAFGDLIEETKAEDSADNPGGQDGEDGFNCGVNGCSRDVDAEDDVCWQHQED